MGLRIVSFAVAFIALGVVAYAGFLKYQANQVEKFTAEREGPLPSTFADILALFKGAPPLVCEVSSSGFEEATSLSMYVYKDMIRVDVTYLSHGSSVVHEIYRDSGAYVWDDVGKKGFFALSTPIPKNSDFEGIAKAKRCSLWTDPMVSRFDPPQTLFSAEVQSQ